MLFIHKTSIFITQISIVFFCTTTLFAQSDSLNTVEIKANTLKNEVINNITNNLYDNLRLQTNVTLKQYGINNIATLRLRGLSAEQTAVTWNDMPLNSPMLGQTDISLLPSVGWSDVRLTETATGGGLHLTSDTKSKQNTVSVQYNTANNLDANFSINPVTIFKKNIAKSQNNEQRNQQRMTFYVKNDENRFLFQPFGKNEKAAFLPHAAQQNYGGMLNHRSILRDSSEISVAAWTNYSRRNLAPTLSDFADEKASKKSQFDFAHRSTIAYLFLQKKANITLGHCYEILDYSDSTTLLFAQSKADRFFLGGKLNIAPKPEIKRFFGLESQINYTYDMAYTSTYQDRTQQQGELKNTLRFRTNEHWQAWFLHRNAMYNNQIFFDILQYGAGADFYKNIKKASFDAHISHERSRRLPTLNERFWQPGGNPNLEPEAIIGSDIALHFTYFFTKNKRFDCTTKTFFIDNYAHIQWLPTDGVWQPQNVGHIESKGASLSANFNYKSLSIKDLYTDFKLNYTFTRATSVDNLLYKTVQNIYIPQHQSSAIWAVGFRQIHFFAQANYVSERTTTTDGTQVLPPYFIVDSGIAYTLKTKKSGDFALHLHVNNLTNTNYQVTRNYAQPLRWLELGLIYKGFP